MASSARHLQLRQDLNKPGELCHLLAWNETLSHSHSYSPWRPAFPQRRAKTHGRMERIPETETIPAVGTDGPRGAADVAVRGS